MSLDLNNNININIMNEEWKLFLGYRVSNAGLVKWNNNGKWERVSRRYNNNNFVTVRLRHKEFGLARLVATLFVPNPGNHRIVTQIDGDKENCSADNLMWADGVKTVSKEKALDRIKRKHGEKYIMIGEFKGTLVPTAFKCQCGHIFTKAPNRMYTENAPCEQCNKEEREEEMKRKRQRKEKERKEFLEKARTQRNHVIYVYKFSDGYAYVGLTCHPERREKDHKGLCRRSQVFKHSQETGIPVPDPIIVEQGLTAKQAITKEKLWVCWLSSSCKMLNKAPAGSLGAYVLNHTLEEAIELLKKKKGIGRQELRDHYWWAYQILKEVNKLPPLPYHKVEHTLEGALEILDRVKTRRKLRDYRWAYRMLEEHGLLPKKNYCGRKPKWRRKVRRTIAELSIKWVDG